MTVRIQAFVVTCVFLCLPVLAHSSGLSEIRKAAQQGNAGAQGNLGLMYREGQGVLQNYIQAHKWLNLAAAGGNSYARAARGAVEQMMTRDQIAKAQTLAQEWEPER